MDPFGTDPGAPDNTYEEHCAVTLNYETQPNEDKDPEDPETFLDYSMTASVELLVFQSGKVDLVKGGAAYDGVPGYDTSLPPSDPANQAAMAAVEKEKPKDPANPWVMVQPIQEFNLAWKRVLAPNWDNIFGAIGKLNEKRYTWLFNRPIGTIMFMGCSGRQEYAFRGGAVIIKPWQLDLKFAMRYLKDENDNTIYGWNYVYNPATNMFQQLLRRLPENKTRPLYDYTDFDKMFQA
jgi:hypothetical protein